MEEPMKRKLIFLDIDGTLIARFSSPSPSVKKAIRAARSNGHKVFLCTGRNMPIIGQDILEVGFDGIIASAGSHVEVDGQVLFDCPLPEETIQECLQAFHSNEIFCRIETADGIYMDTQMQSLLRNTTPDPSNSELVRMQKELESGLDIRPYDEYPRKGAYKICFSSATLEAISQAKARLGDRFHFVVHPFFTSSSCYNGEIIRKDLGKGHGMDIVCHHYGATRQDSIAFGDSMNDYEMMKAAGTSVAMGNACQELKDMADNICESVDHDGIYHEFLRLGLM